MLSLFASGFVGRVVNSLEDFIIGAFVGESELLQFVETLVSGAVQMLGRDEHLVG